MTTETHTTVIEAKLAQATNEIHTKLDRLHLDTEVSTKGLY